MTIEPYRAGTSDLHVIPINDLRDHDETPECWCRPRRDDDEPSVIVHNSMDQRETHEAGRKMQ